MSTIGLVSGSLEREQEQLRILSAAMLALEADLLGYVDELGFSASEVQNSRSIIADFVAQIYGVLDEHTDSADFQTLRARIQAGSKRLDDWQEDLKKLELHLKDNTSISIETLAVMNDVMSLLDNEFTKDLRRLYGR